MVENRIPVAIGISGHRAIRGEDVPALRTAVKEQLEAVRAACPHSPLQVLTSLAEGADLLCAEAAAELGIPLVAVLPMEAGEYTKDFSPEDKAAFERHCAAARQVLIAPHTEPIPAEGVSTEYLYRQAGLYVSRHSHVLLALWDGREGRSGCGTAEAVQFSLTERRGVVHIAAPRREKAEEPAGSIHKLGDWAGVNDTLARTDTFNRAAAALPAGGGTDRLLPEGGAGDDCSERLETLYGSANRLSLNAAERYRKSLAVIACISTVLTMAFLLYDEVELTWMIFIVGAMLLTVWQYYRAAVRGDHHRAYVEYRALAEWLRVQVFLRYAGSRLQVTDLLTWSQKEETCWVQQALDVVCTGPDSGIVRDIRDCWVEDQRAYHGNAGKKSLRKDIASERTVKTALLVTVGLYLFALLFEISLSAGLLWKVFPATNPRIWRTVLKVAVGSMSVLTLFVSNYYGKQSLDRVTSDHGKMERFYADMSRKLQESGQTEALLEELAREELIENGNWVSYQRGNAPSLDF